MTDQTGNSESTNQLLRFAVEIVSAYVTRNDVPTGQLTEILKVVHGTLNSLRRKEEDNISFGNAKPAVPIRKSVTPDYIICLEDGKKLKMLKRYLRSTYNMTPDEYRTKWNLGPDYPLVAPNYAKQRSAFAKKIGLGRKSRPSA